MYVHVYVHACVMNTAIVYVYVYSVPTYTNVCV